MKMFQHLVGFYGRATFHAQFVKEPLLQDDGTLGFRDMA